MRSPNDEDNEPIRFSDVLYVLVMGVLLLFVLASCGGAFDSLVKPIGD